MDSLLGAFLAEIAVLCLTGCTQTMPRSAPVQLPPKRIVQLGYSLVPLNETGWFVVRRTPGYVALLKAGRNPDDTMAIQARSFDLPVSRKREELPLLPPEFGLDVVERFKLVKSELAPDGPSCDRRHLVMDDRAPERRSGSKSPMVLEVLVLTCAHPRNGAMGIDVIYSQRYDPGQRDTEFDARADRLLQSVQFANP